MKSLTSNNTDMREDKLVRVTVSKLVMMVLILILILIFCWSQPVHAQQHWSEYRMTATDRATWGSLADSDRARELSWRAAQHRAVFGQVDPTGAAYHSMGYDRPTPPVQPSALYLGKLQSEREIEPEHLTSLSGYGILDDCDAYRTRLERSSLGYVDTGDEEPILTRRERKLRKYAAYWRSHGYDLDAYGSPILSLGDYGATMNYQGAGYGTDVYVGGYYRNNGAYVNPYHRSASDGNFSNNYSTHGNVNPYTGRMGTNRR